MTRSQRIALAMWANRDERAFDEAIERTTDAQWAAVFRGLRCCYDAMDDLDPYQDVNPSESIVFVRGNAGMLCA